MQENREMASSRWAHSGTWSLHSATGGSMRALIALILACPLLVAGQQAPSPQPGQTPASSKIWIGREAEFEQFLKTAEIKKIVDVGQGVTNPRRAFFAPAGLAGSGIIKA